MRSLLKLSQKSYLQTQSDHLETPVCSGCNSLSQTFPCVLSLNISRDIFSYRRQLTSENWFIPYIKAKNTNRNSQTCQSTSSCIHNCMHIRYNVTPIVFMSFHFSNSNHFLNSNQIRIPRTLNPT